MLSTHIFKVSVVDTRNIQRLNKGNKIKIIKAIHNGNVLEVQLLDGLERNRNFFVITNDLFIDYVEVTTTKKI